MEPTSATTTTARGSRRLAPSHTPCPPRPLATPLLTGSSREHWQRYYSAPPAPPIPNPPDRGRTHELTDPGQVDSERGPDRGAQGRHLCRITAQCRCCR